MRREAADRALVDPSTAGRVARVLVPAAAIAGVVALPLLVPGEPQAELVGLAAIFGCVGISLRMLLGHLGLLSLGHQAFVGLGALISALLTSHPAIGLPFGLGAAGAVVLVAAVAAAVGYPALRAGGRRLAVVTLAFGVLVERTVFAADAVRGGVVASRPAGFEGDRAYAYLCLGALGVAMAVDWRLQRTKGGRAFRVIRDDERVAAAYGIDVTGGKVLGLTVSAAVAASAGALLAGLHGSAGDRGEAELALALTFVAMTVVGGSAHRLGVVLASALFAVLGTALARLGTAVPLLAGGAAVQALVGGVLLLAVVAVYPGGIGRALRPLERWVRGGRLAETRRGPGAEGDGVGGP